MAVRGKYAEHFEKGTNLVLLESEIAKHSNVNLKMPNIGINMLNMGMVTIKANQGQPLRMVDALFSKTEEDTQ